MGLLMQYAFCYTMRREYKIEGERNVVIFFCFRGANCHGVGNPEMVWDAGFQFYILGCIYGVTDFGLLGRNKTTLSYSY